MIRTILKSLLKPDAYPEPTTSVVMVQTHISWIFLTDSHAYKVKKPVDFGFLNFSTIDRRRFYCNEEVRLNRRLCPDIYEGVVELRETATGAAFHGTGPVIDHAVRMKRLPQERMLNLLVDRGEVFAADLADVARAIASFHLSTLTSPAIAEYGRLDRIMYNWQENFDQMVPFEATTLSAPERRVISDWVAAFAAKNAELFAQRVAGGFIREGDGDLHLENICMTAAGIRIFDCIEFNERFRYCDNASDLAFLLMDLDVHGRPDLAETVVTTYRESTGDSGMMPLIDFYKIYRAFVRGKVESFRGSDTGIGHEEQERAKARAISYFRLARGYLERHRLPPTLFITCGLMGSGESALAAQLAFEVGITRLNSDLVRKTLVGIPPDTAVTVPYATGLYDPAQSAATYAELLRLAEAELTAGRSVIIDAGFMRRDDRLMAAAVAERCAARFVILLVACDDAENRRRLQDRSAHGRSVSDGRLELLDQQRQQFEPPESEEGIIIPLASAEAPHHLTSAIYARLG